jgi:F0F1-type ATP synthase alpha subunit
MYYKGMRPAVNIPLSVTRVGRQTLNKLYREINKEMTTFLSTYEKVQNLSHFGQELTDDVKKSLARGDMLYLFFNQPYQLTIPAPVQTVMVALILGDAVPDRKTMEDMRVKLTDGYIDPKVQALIAECSKTTDVKTFNENVLKAKTQLFSLCGITIEPPRTNFTAAVVQTPPAQAPVQPKGQPN